MFSVGFVTVVSYLTAIRCFFLGMYYTNFFAAGLVFGAVFFLISSAVVGVTVKGRI